MAHFVYPAGTPLGVVPFGYVVPSAEWASTLVQLFKAVNGDEGGTWAPSSFITIGGSGLELTGTGHSLAASARLNVENAAEVRLKNGALLKADGSVGDIRLEVLSNVATLTAQSATVVNLDGTTNVKGDVTFKSTGPATLAFETGVTVTWASGSTAVHASGSTTTLAGTTNVSGTGAVTFLTGSSLTAQSSVTGTWAGAWAFGSTVDVTGAATFSSTVVCNSALTVATNATVSGNLAVTGTTTCTAGVTLNGTLTANGVSTFTDEIVRSGVDAYESLRSSNGTDGNVTITAEDKDVWTASITTNRTWTLNDGPTGKALRVVFVAPASNVLTITAPGFLSVQLSRVALSGDYKIVELVWARTEWLLLCGETV